MKIKRFDQLFIQYKPYLYKYACSLCRNSGEADDLLQETYIRARTAVVKLQEGTLLRQYLKTILRNINCNNLRKNWSKSRRLPGKRCIHLTIELADERYCPSGEFEKRETTRLIRTALDKLPEKLRKPLVLNNYYNKSYPAIAAMNRLPVGTVRSRIYRGKKKMFKMLVQEQQEMDRFEE